MKISIKDYLFDLSTPTCISTTLKSGQDNPKAFYAPDPNIEPVRTDTFVGSTEEGGILNFKNIFINPHGNGTHTECVGHISKEPFYIKDCLKKHHFLAKLVTINPETFANGDNVITTNQIKSLSFENEIEAIIIRTTPNSEIKLTKDWSGSNPPYIQHEAMKFLVENGIKHFLIDTPSVDREEDEGKLLAHKTFWNYPSENIYTENTITEMIYVANEIKDGIYLLNIQTLPLAMDASPSNIFIFKSL
jgi:arylformamidase